MKLREWLYRKRLTIKEFAIQIGYDREYVQTWLSGRREPSLTALDLVTKFTGGIVNTFEDLKD